MFLNARKNESSGHLKSEHKTKIVTILEYHLKFVLVLYLVKFIPYANLMQRNIVFPSTSDDDNDNDNGNADARHKNSLFFSE